MSFETNKIVIALLLIKKGAPFNNSYKLIRIFEHQFRFSPLNILNEIRKKKFVNYELVNGIYYYHVTSSGIEYLKQELITAKEELLNEYPNQTETIALLFS